MTGGTFTRCDTCQRLILAGQTCTCGTRDLGGVPVDVSPEFAAMSERLMERHHEVLQRLADC